jgi:WD40 repeat protein
MGVVYKARQVRLGRVVALKMILAGGHAEEQDLARFRAEAEAVARLRHPHVVQIYEVGEHDGLPFFSLEFCPGGSLARRLNGTPLPPPEAARLVETLARAMQAAHEKGVVHRDLKPANVLLAEDGQPKVTDFGLAKRLDAAGQTVSGTVLGTPSYMAPEQAQGQAKGLGPAADVYALGAILYELLTGRPPFKAPTALETLRQVVAEEPVPPTRLQKTPRDLETICLKCLQKEPGKRYASAAALADDLQRYLAGQAVRARPVWIGERLWRWCRRNPVLAASVGLTVAALLAVVAVSASLGVSQSRVAADLRRQTEQTQAALEEAKGHRRQAERLSAAAAVGQGLSLCEQGDVGPGMLWLARALDTAPEDDPGLRRYIRTSLAAWRQQLCPVQFIHSLSTPVTAIAPSPDGQAVLEGTLSGTPYLAEVDSGKRLVIGVHQYWVSVVAFSPDGRQVVTGSWDQTARVWKRAVGIGPGAAVMEHHGRVYAVAFSPDGKALLTGSDDKIAQLWDARTGKPLGEALRHSDAVRAVAFRPGDGAVLTASEDMTIRLWDAGPGRIIGEVTGPLRPRQRLLAAAFSPDASLVVTGSPDGTAQVWVAATGQPVGPALRHREAVRAVAFGPDAQTVLTGSSDGTARLWDAATGEPLSPPLRHLHGVGAVAVSHDGKTLLTAADKRVWGWEAPRRAPKGATLRHPGGIRCMAFSQDGKAVLTGGTDKAARLWEAVTGKPVGQPLLHQDTVAAVALSRDGAAALTGSIDKTARLWDALTGKPGAALRHRFAVHAVASAWTAEWSRR